MKKLNCELLVSSNSRHLQQIYTGFRVLYRKGLIDLKQRIVDRYPIDTSQPPHLQNAKHAHLKVIVNDEKILYYDTHDSFEVVDDILEEVDFYFKRSYCEKATTHHLAKEKIFPLGLYYFIFDDYLIDTLAFQRLRVDDIFHKIKNFFKVFGLDYLLGKRFYLPRMGRCACYPPLHVPPKVLFMARAWDPAKTGTSCKFAEREAINEMRANCVRWLRKELGDKFFGGLIHTEFSSEYYEDCLLPNKRVSSKENYMKLMHQFPICVTTTGLHKSIGGKLAEYVCYSKAIITEPLYYQVPGDFAPEKNYITFTTPEECVEAAVRLIEDSNLRRRLMLNNYQYYQTCLRPDSLILQTLLKAYFSQ